MVELIAQSIARAGSWADAVDRCYLTYEQRFLRRKMLTSITGLQFLVDLPHTESADHGDAFMLRDGRYIEVVAAPETLLAVSGDDLVRLAWHIGNRHCPCQVEPARLLIGHDHVLADMLHKLGATLRHVVEPFSPEGGAYGHGRTHAHAH